MRTSHLQYGIVLAMFLINGCSNNGTSASKLYSFSDTKPVAVRVTIDYKLDGAQGPTVEDATQTFFLNAFLIGDEETQVLIGNGSDAALDLPVSLQGTHLEFDTTVHVPATIKPGAEGYTFRFNLIERGTTSYSFFGLNESTEATSVKNLDALKDRVLPGTAAEVNPVGLSLATTLTYKLAKDTGQSSSITTYKKILELIESQISETESSLDPTKMVDLGTFASAILAGLKLKLTTDQDLQSSVADALQRDGAVERTSNEGDSIEVQFTNLLKEFSTDLKASLGNNDTAVAQVFKSNTIKLEDIPDPDTYVSVIYAPASLSFTDTDIKDSIGGEIEVSSPKVQKGIQSFNIYLSSASKSDAEKQFLGNISSTASPLTLAVDSGTSLSANQTHFWVYPVASGTELDLGASIKIQNLQIPDGLTYESVDSTYTQNSPINQNNASSTGASIQSFSISPTLPVGLSFNATTGAISGTPSAVSGKTDYTVVGKIGDKSTSAKISITVRVAAPAGLTYAVKNASYTAGTLITNNTVSSTGGQIASYSVSPTLPAGLSLNASTGIISGRPTTTTASTTYTVTGSNATGSTSTSIKIAVLPAPPASVTLNPPSTIKSGVNFLLTGTCSGELGTIAVDIGNDNASTAGVTADPLSCTCQNSTFTCNAIAIDYSTFGSESVSYKTTITSQWAGSGSHTSASSTKVLYLDLGATTTINDNAAYTPTGTCSPNGATITLTSQSGFTPASKSCGCTAHSLNGCGNLTEGTASLNTNLSLAASLTYSGNTFAATKTIKVFNAPPEVLSSASGAGNAYQSSQLGGLSFTRYGHNNPVGNLVSHDELMDFIDDPEGSADGYRADNTEARHAYNFAGTSSLGWIVSSGETQDKYADANDEITPVTGGDSFGDTYKGYFVPPVNGVYKFVVTGVDNSVRLMMSPNECPKDAIAVVSADWAANDGGVDPDSIWINGNNGSYSGSNRYNHRTRVFFPAGTPDSEYADGTVYLVANKIYYFEIRYGEGGGSNAFSFGMDRRDFNSSTWDGVANLKANTMLPYAGADKYIPRQACGGSSYNAAELFSDPEGDTMTYGAYLVASDGSSLPDAEADISYINLSFNSATGQMSGVVNGQYNGQKIVFTARDSNGSNEITESDPITLNP